jgi:hypothetical protein
MAFLLGPERFYNPRTNRVIDLPKISWHSSAHCSGFDLGTTIEIFSTSFSIAPQCNS